MEMKFSKTAKQCHTPFKAFLPFPKACERNAYENLDAALKETIVKEGEQYLGYQYPAIYATDFMKFTRTGNRTEFETLYYASRHALCALTAAECVEYQGRFLDDIINGIFVVCEQSAWQLPPHNTYIRDTPQHILPDSTRPVLDLFACETGALLSCITYLLREALDKISPFITARMHWELERRIITPYLAEHFWWMGAGDEPMCNWTAWCTQNVLLTAFLEDFDDSKRLQVFQKAAESCDYFLKDYGDDGCCDEGAQYYRHAGLCLFNAMEVLNTVSNDAFQPLFAWEKIKNIALYIVNVHVDGKYYFNFADCSPIAGRAGVQEFLFGKYTQQPVLMQFAADEFRAANRPLYSDEVNQISLYHRLQTIFYQKEVLSYHSETPAAIQDIFYPSVGLFLTRSQILCLAVKAGNNDDNHNHNDTGSFTVYKNGKPVFVDIGVESYTKKTFSPDRYEIWTMQSGYHNLPTLMGLDEKDGADYCAQNVAVLQETDTASISMELAGAYPLSAAKNSTVSPSYSRTVTLSKTKNTITINDCTNLSDVILNFITYEKPAVHENILQIGSLAAASLEGAVLYTIEVLPITDARLKTAWDHDLYRVRLKMTGPEFKMEIS